MGWMFLDSVIMQLFPNSYLVDGLMLFSQLGFCAMILTIRRFSFLDSILFTALCGLVFDFLYANTFLVHATIYVFMAMLVRLWSKHMDDSVIETMVLSIVTIFIKDFMVYVWMSFQQDRVLDFMLWVQRYELKSIICAVIGILFIYYFHQIKEDYIERKAQALRRGESVEWFRLQSKH
jgi:hypothetical protein